MPNILDRFLFFPPPNSPFTTMLLALVMSEWSAEEVAPQKHTGIKRFVEGTKSQVNFACV